MTLCHSGFCKAGELKAAMPAVGFDPTTSPL